MSSNPSPSDIRGPSSSNAEETAPYGTGAPSSSALTPGPGKKIRTSHLAQMKRRGEKFAVLTSYDTYTARIFDEAGIEAILIGDSAANNVYGYPTSLPVTVEELIPLARAVASSVRRALVFADLPFGSYQASPEQAYITAARFLKEAGVAAIKLEGGAEMAPQIARLVKGGIPVCAHIGFTPQYEHVLGGYRVQGRGEAAELLLADALAVQRAGAFAVLLEMVPGDVATRISQELEIPTIGIGAGPGTDAQVMVWQDAFGLNTGRLPRFVKQYADLHGVLLDGARAYAAEVKDGSFPSPEHTF